MNWGAGVLDELLPSRCFAVLVYQLSEYLYLGLPSNSDVRCFLGLVLRDRECNSVFSDLPGGG